MHSFLLLLIGLVCASAVAAPSAELSDPVGDWRYNVLLDCTENPQGVYPTPPIDRGVQRNRTMIEGQIKAIGTQRAPHTLAGNGNPLNLYTDDQGRFTDRMRSQARIQERAGIGAASGGRCHCDRSRCDRHSIANAAFETRLQGWHPRPFSVAGQCGGGQL
jgi:hypothetical protein